MKRNLLLLTLLGTFWLSSCSHSNIICQTCCTGTCVNNDATLSVTMSAIPLAPPPGTSILSFSFTITGIALTPTTGSDISIPMTAATYVLDATQLQSDSALIGQANAMVPPGTYNKITLAVSSAAVTFCTTSGTAGCTVGSVTTVPANPLMSTPSSPVTLTLAANDKQGLRVVLNIAPTLSPNGQTITGLTLTPTTGTVLTAVALPPAKSSLASRQLDFVEDFTGIVTGINGNAVAVKTSEHGNINAVANSSTSFSPNCLTATFAGCITVGQLASIDTALNADGTFTLLEYDPLEATASDWIEGTVTSVPTSTTQFQIVANDVFLKAAGSIIVGTSLQDAPVTVNFVNPGPVTFAVDDKGLNVPLADSTNFKSANDTSFVKPGQTVAVRVKAFTAASSSTPASATVDIIMLRFTRVTGNVASAPGTLSFSINNLPPYFGTTSAQTVQLNQTSGAATNYDGMATTGDLSAGNTVSIRAIYFPTSTTQPFSAAKVRKQ